MKPGNSSSSNYLSKPKLGALRTSYTNLKSPKSSSVYNGSLFDKDGSNKSKKSKNRKNSNGTKMDYLKKRAPDYTDFAYRDAVTRLRYLLNESYSGSTTGSKFGCHRVEDSGEDTDDRSLLGVDRPDLSRHLPPRTYSRLSATPKRVFNYTKENLFPSYRKENILRPTLTQQNNFTGASGVTPTSDAKKEPNKPAPELMSFIERQDDYIEQLERESQYCREELSNLLGKVKDVISENESLHEAQKNGIIRNMFDQSETEYDTNDSDAKTEIIKTKPPKIKLEGPSIVFESRISELEAHLTQAKIELKKLQDENETLRKKNLDAFSGDSIGNESYRKQLDNLQRDKQSLESSVAKLQTSLTQMRETESDSLLKAKRAQGALEQSTFEKNQQDLEIRRLKEELEKQYDRVREANHETARRVAEERAAADRRYCAQVDQLGGDLSNQWETANKLQLELERQRRIESDYKREIAQRNNQIDDLKMELKNKIATLQSDLAQANAEKQSVEQELASARLTLERSERQFKSEQSRLTSEITSLRQRLDRSDSDLLHARRENLRMSEQLASLEKEVTLNSLTSDVKPNKDLTLMIQDMEDKHASTVQELENMVQNQTRVMDKLTDECKTLTQKLEDASNRHKQDKLTLKSANADLMDKLKLVWKSYKNLNSKYQLEVTSDSEQQHYSTSTTDTESQSTLLLQTPPNTTHETYHQYQNTNSNQMYQSIPTNQDQDQNQPNQKEEMTYHPKPPSITNEWNQPFLQSTMVTSTPMKRSLSQSTISNMKDMTLQDHRDMILAMQMKDNISTKDMIPISSMKQDMESTMDRITSIPVICSTKGIQDNMENLQEMNLTTNTGVMDLNYLPSSMKNNLGCTHRKNIEEKMHYLRKTPSPDLQSFQKRKYQQGLIFQEENYQPNNLNYPVSSYDDDKLTSEGGYCPSKSEIEYPEFSISSPSLFNTSPEYSPSESPRLHLKDLG